MKSKSKLGKLARKTIPDILGCQKWAIPSKRVDNGWDKIICIGYMDNNP
jgi:hypothetical protein